MDVYCLPGLNLSIEGDDSPVRSALEESFRLSKRFASDKGIPLRAYVLPCGEMDRVYPEWLSEKISQMDPSDNVVMLYGDTGDKAAVAVSECAIDSSWTSTAADEIRFLCCKRSNKPSPLSVQSVLVPVLREVLSSRGGILLHAAALVCSNNIGMLISADGGGGKTTTALSLMRQGARILSDDLVIYQVGQAGSQIFGILEHLNITSRTAFFFEELTAIANDSSPGEWISGKLRVDPHSVYGHDCTVKCCTPHLLYFLNITKAGPSVEPLSTADALMKLIKAHTFAFGQRMTKESADRLLSLLYEVKPLVLNTGPDPERLGKWLISQCAEHTSR